MKQQRLAYSTEQSPFGRAIGKAVGIVLTLAVLVVAFMFSIVFFAIALTVGLLLGARIWWKTRKLREAMRQQGFVPPEGGAPAEEGRIIEGEVVREER